MGFYGDDLAWIHHVGFSGFAAAAAPEIVALLRRTGIDRGRVVDLGCGSGELARELSEAGYEVLGVDVSAPILELARRQAPRARFVAASLDTFEPPTCDALIALGEPLAYLPDAGEATPLDVLFRRFAAALRPGGRLVFDLIVSGRPMRYRTWTEGDGWTVCVEVDEDVERRLLTRRIVTFRELDGAVRRSEERHRQRVVVRAEVEGALRDAGFAVRVARGYGAARLPPRRLAFLARRVR